MHKQRYEIYSASIIFQQYIVTPKVFFEQTLHI